MCPLLLIKLNLVCNHQSRVAEVGFESMPLWPKNPCLTVKQDFVLKLWPGQPESLTWPSASQYSWLALIHQDGFGELTKVGFGKWDEGTVELLDNHGCCWGNLNACLGVVEISGLISVRPQRADTTQSLQAGDGSGRAERKVVIPHAVLREPDKLRAGFSGHRLWPASAWGRFGLLLYNSGDLISFILLHFKLPPCLKFPFALTVGLAMDSEHHLNII